MGNAVKASKKGFTFECVCDKYHAKGKLIKNKINVVINANLNERINGVNSNEEKISIINHFQYGQITRFYKQCDFIFYLQIHPLSRSYSYYAFKNHPFGMQSNAA